MLCYKCREDTVQSFYVRVSTEPGKRTSKSIGYVCINPECDFCIKFKPENSSGQ